MEPDFTRRYIDGSNHEALGRRIQNSFDRAAWEKDFTIIEGSGHAGVGSEFDLSNVRVARLLHSKILLVVPGGIGRPIDEAALNAALCKREGVEIGAVSSANLRRRLDPRTLLIVPGDREDIVLAAITEAAPCGLLSGLILSDGLRPHRTLLSMLEKTDIPVVFSPEDSYAIAQRIHSLTVKIHRIQDLVARHLDVDRLLEKLGRGAGAAA